MEDGLSLSEPASIPDPGGEGEGIVLSIVNNIPIGKRCFHLVLDARTFKEIARAEVGHLLPNSYNNMASHPSLTIVHLSLMPESFHSFVGPLAIIFFFSCSTTSLLKEFTLFNTGRFSSFDQNTCPLPKLDSHI